MSSLASMTEEKEETQLHEALQRLEALCRKLWDADSPAAVVLQAVIDEFSSAVHRAEQTITNLRQRHDELQQTAARDSERALKAAAGESERRIKAVEERLASTEAALAEREARLQTLAADLAEREAQNLEFHERYLKSAAEQDESRAKKMEAFYKGLSDKEAELESLWEKRHAALEAEHKQRVDAFKQRQAALLEEIGARAAVLEDHYIKVGREAEAERERLRAEREAWEAGRLAESRTISQRQQELAAQAESLAGEYQRKRAELQRVKESMQAELTRVIQEYQARKGSGGGRP